MRIINSGMKKLIPVIVIIWGCLVLAWYLGALAYRPGKPPLSTMYFPTRITATDRPTSTPTSTPTMKPMVTQATMAPTSTKTVVITPTGVVYPTVEKPTATPRPYVVSEVKSSAVKCVLVRGEEPVMFCRVVR